MIRFNKRVLSIIFLSFFITLIFSVSYKNVSEAKNSNMIIDVTKAPYNAKADGIEDDTNAIQWALDMAKENESTTILIPEGTYKITKRLIIYKNTHIKMDKGTTLLRSHNAGFFINGESTDIFYGFSGNGNITIEGGTLDGNIEKYTSGFNAIGLAHGYNIKILNVTIKDVINAHAIDLNSSKDVLIEGCKFIGFKDTTVNKENYYSESIQISPHTKLGFSGFGAWDGTTCENVTIKDSYFGPSGTPGTQAPAVAIGNHSSVHNIFIKDINILNNRFNGMTYAGVRLFKFNNSVVKYNIFENTNRGIVISSTAANSISSQNIDGSQSGKPQAGADYQILNNIFKDTIKENIYAAGSSNEIDTAKVTNINIKNNVFINKNSITGRDNMFFKLTEGVNIEENNIITLKK